MSVLNTKVLVLNRSYLPVHITSVRRALSLLYQDIAHAVDDEYRTFDFASWADLAADEDAIGLGRPRHPRAARDPAAVVRSRAAPARALQPLQHLRRATRTAASTAAGASRARS